MMLRPATQSLSLNSLPLLVETLQEYHTILLGHMIKIYMDHKNLTFSNFKTKLCLLLEADC